MEELVSGGVPNDEDDDGVGVRWPVFTLTNNADKGDHSQSHISR